MIDWEQAYARLERARQALDAGARRSPEEARRILEERARAVARPRQEPAVPSSAVDVLVFSLGEERYGVEMEFVLDVAPCRGLTPVPCTRPPLRGVMSHRGRILPVLDLRSLLGGGPAAAEGGRVVAVEAEGLSFGILADAIVAPARIEEDRLAPPAAARGARGLVRGVTADMVAVLDLPALVQDPRIVVDEQVG